MKKIFVFALSLSALAFTSSVFADPVGIHVQLRCPIPGDPASVLANYGDFVAGNGFENVQGLDNNIYFKSKLIPNNLPTNLNDYRNAGMNYDSTKGEVTCRYMMSSSEFSVSYTMTNGKGGFVSNQSPSSLNITLPVAFTK